ncbi:putative peroxygenase 5 [Curcuma longa]|uniref:putative peroxygenase 5 n=1 Tax=Curcuma longa TaxID=136217 RepID=UPI003D9DF78C
MASSAPTGEHQEKQVIVTPLQKHATFFDRNNDGVIYPSETYQGLRAIGNGIAVSTVAALFINGFLSAKTKPAGKFPSPLLPIYIKNIEKARHGSDTGVYDKEGCFDGSKFEEIFQKHAKTNPDYLTSKELDDMLRANRVPKDFLGRIGSWGEWKMLYNLCKDKDGLLHKETIRAVYDGSVFYKLEEERQASKAKD